MPRRATTVLAALLVILLPLAAAAQTGAEQAAAASAPRRAWLVGGALGVPGGSGQFAPDLFTVGLQATQFAPRRPGLDLAIGIAPRVIRLGGVGARAGVTVPLALGDRVVLMPTAGVSGLASLTEGEGLYGYHGGVSLVFGDRSGATPRLSVTAHQFNEADRPVWLFEFGFARLSPRTG
jgi:hypothetical protein